MIQCSLIGDKLISDWDVYMKWFKRSITGARQGLQYVITLICWAPRSLISSFHPQYLCSSTSQFHQSCEPINVSLCPTQSCAVVTSEQWNFKTAKNYDSCKCVKDSGCVHKTSFSEKSWVISTFLKNKRSLQFLQMMSSDQDWLVPKEAKWI